MKRLGLTTFGSRSKGIESLEGRNLLSTLPVAPVQHLHQAAHVEVVRHPGAAAKAAAAPAGIRLLKVTDVVSGTMAVTPVAGSSTEMNLTFNGTGKSTLLKHVNYSFTGKAELLADGDVHAMILDGGELTVTSRKGALHFTPYGGATIGADGMATMHGAAELIDGTGNLAKVTGGESVSDFQVNTQAGTFQLRCDMYLTERR